MFRGGVIMQFIKDCLFPVFCLGCEKEGVWWCDDCVKKSFSGREFYCPVCHVKNLNGKNCPTCQAVSSLEAVAAFFNYQENRVVSELIKKFKYSLVADINQLLARIIKEFLGTIWQKGDLPNYRVLIVPVPLHNQRRRERGFNQADLIAQNIFEVLKKDHPNIRLDNTGLQRIKFTKQQARLDRSERLENLKGVFGWRGQKSIGQNVILVDDVFTSGATMQECARVLKLAGAQKVYGVVMARD